ncbi:LysE family translocator [Mesorhizobium sp. M7A.F.Ca.MR.148.00.0.0]|uniref:LysE family translocator n=1 Tax=Mesorhizobium sp. M7A.F.Ca.MR.148.00.0.0 TaxID=2496775 RepID=UPI001FE0F053|nr:LysE family translocator [Mesorhizobium sp. M7A.F.Ca.MR.148.00.0.0]
MLVMARGIGQGRDVALFTVLGMTLGAGLVQLPLIAFGLSSLVHASPLAFNLLRWAGAAYIVWLGVRLLLSSSATIPTGDLKALRPLAAAREGMIANLSNPWPLMFMVAFLPQFVDPHRGSVTLQLVLLGATQKPWHRARPGHGSCGTLAQGFGSSGSPALSSSASAYGWRSAAVRAADQADERAGPNTRLWRRGIFFRGKFCAKSPE